MCEGESENNKRGSIHIGSRYQFVCGYLSGNSVTLLEMIVCICLPHVNMIKLAKKAMLAARERLN